MLNLKSKGKKEYSIKILMGIATTALLGLFITYIINFHSHEISPDSPDWGVFGDFLGGTAGAVFGFCSFMALLYGLKKQKDELKEERKQKKLQRLELTFFNLMSQKLNIINGLDFSHKSLDEVNKYHGEAVFFIFVKIIKDLHKKLKNGETDLIKLERSFDDVRVLIGNTNAYFVNLHIIAELLDRWKLSHSLLENDDDEENVGSYEGIIINPSNINLKYIASILKFLYGELGVFGPSFSKDHSLLREIIKLGDEKAYEWAKSYKELDEKLED